MKWLAILFLGCAASGQLTGVRKLYVEPFTVKDGSAAKLREDVIEQLRKLSSISVVSEQANADATLTGDGEIWIRGYRSLNPRSGRLPSNGTPVYSGFLSVELKDPAGETVWSYLASPGAGSEDISKDLSKRIARHLADALEQAPHVAQSASIAATDLKGAGATFPAPLYAKWIASYKTHNPNVQIAYDPVGSEEGVRRLVNGAVDFGASESPEVVRDGYLLFPTAVGAAVPIVNLPGMANELSLTPEALAGIYLGKITKWNDPVLRQTNRGVRLPDLDIVVVHRADGSGTSYTWTEFLSKTNPEWKAQIGAALAPKWAVGKGATGNDGVAKLVKELGGSIGYVEYIYALQNHLSFAKVRNRNGEFVAADLESIAAAADSTVMSSDLKTSITDAPGAGVYPISSFTWLVVPAHISDAAKRTQMVDFLQWILGPGQRQAAALGYLALPSRVAAKVESAIPRIH